MTRRRPGRVAAVLVAVVVAGCAGGEAGEGTSTTLAPSLSVDFTPAPGTPVAAAEVAGEVVAAIRSVVDAPIVEVNSVGFTENRRSDLGAVVDSGTGRLWVGELISDGTPLGGGLAAEPIVSETVIVGNQGWLRVLQPGQDPDTPFQFIDVTGLTDQFMRGALTQAGRVFDGLDVVAELVGTVPFEAERLETRTVLGEALSGVRATFDVDTVAQFLDTRGLAVTHAGGEFHQHRDDESLVLEFWYSSTALREMVATGVQFQDGEALDTSARITYRIVTGAQIEPPSNTVVP